MSAETRASIIVFLILLVAGAGVFFGYRYESNSNRADAAESLAKQRLETINDMTVRQRDVAALDAKYTGELADAKANIDQLERDIAAGRKRLQLNAKCPANGTASTPGVDDATGPRLTDAAQRDYFTLRERIETITTQLTGLQAYVREQCLK